MITRAERDGSMVAALRDPVIGMAFGAVIVWREDQMKSNVLSGDLTQLGNRQFSRPVRRERRKPGY